MRARKAVDTVNKKKGLKRKGQKLRFRSVDRN